MAQENRRASARLAHHIERVVPIGQPKDQVAGAQTPRIDRPVPQGTGAGSEAPATRRPALALTAEGPRRADLIAWVSAHQASLRGVRLLAPNGIGSLLAEQVGLHTEPLRSGTAGPAAAAGLAAAGEIDAMVAFTDPIELRAGDTTTRSLTRLAVFWDIPIASNRATADLLLSLLARPRPPAEAPPAIEGGGPAPRVTPADAHALVDDRTRALTTRLLRGPDDLPAVLVRAHRA